MNIHVRKAEAADIPAIVDLWTDFMEFLKSTNVDYWKMNGGGTAFARYLTRSMEDFDVLVAVAEAGKGDLIGFSLARIERLPEWFAVEPIGLVRYLAISADHRGHGVGKQVANYVMDWFRSMGIKRVELYVLDGWPASKFWSKMGFKKFMDRRFLEI